MKWYKTLALLSSTLIIIGCSANKELSQSYSSIAMYVPAFVSSPPTASQTEGNKIIDVLKQPVSITNGIIDSNSYTNMRRAISQNRLPQKESINLESWLNYFIYDYPEPQKDAIFSITPEIAPTPWNPESKLLVIGVKTKETLLKNRLPVNLTIIADTSYSMENRAGLPVMQNWLRLLTDQLNADDQLTLLTYSPNPRLLLASVKGDQKNTIHNAINELTAQELLTGMGSVELAYHLTEINYNSIGSNHIILANGGNFYNLDSGIKQLEKLIEKQSKKGILFSTVAFSFENYDYNTMLKLAKLGGGSHHYIDIPTEANRVIQTQLMGFFPLVANELELQVNFNPAHVSHYRLLGYNHPQNSSIEPSLLYTQNIHSNYTYTVLYEITLNSPLVTGNKNNELAFVRARYKLPLNNINHYLDISLLPSKVKSSLSKASNDFRFAAAVAAFSQQFNIQETEPTVKNYFTTTDVIKLANSATGKDPLMLRKEFMSIVEKSRKLTY